MKIKSIKKNSARILITLTYFSLSSCKSRHFGESSNVKVIGGRIISESEFPATVIFANFMCTGAVISRRHILTSAHCFTNGHPGPYTLEKGAKIQFTGSKKRDEKVEMISKSMIAVHIPQSWLNSNQQYSSMDLAIIETAEDIVEIPSAQLSFDTVVAGTKITHVGAGCEGSRRPDWVVYSRQLAADTFVITPEEALAQIPVDQRSTSTINEITSTNLYSFSPGLIFKNKEMPSLCQGDSGGPVYTLKGGKDFIVGVNSLRYKRPEANEAYFQAFARIDTPSGAESWIQSVIGINAKADIVVSKPAGADNLLKALIKPCGEIFSPRRCEMQVGKAKFEGSGSNECEARNTMFNDIIFQGVVVDQADLQTIACKP